MSATQFINEIKYNDAGLLHKCAFDDNIDAVVALSALPYFSEVVDHMVDGWTPLHAACAVSNRTHLDMIKLLVDNGADITKQKEEDGLSAIHFAASNNDVHLLDYILETAGPGVVLQENHEGWTPAHFACFLQNFDALNLLLENGADLAKCNENGYSAFD